MQKSRPHWHSCLFLTGTCIVYIAPNICCRISPWHLGVIEVDSQILNSPGKGIHVVYNEFIIFRRDKKILK